MKKPTLTHRPNPGYAYEGITVKFAQGAPLSADQLHFLSNHEKYLSAHHLDHVTGYYLKSPFHRPTSASSYLLHGHALDEPGALHLKRRIEALIAEHRQPLSFQLKPEEYLQFRAATINELILYHGNQFLTGAPFYLGGIPYTIYFQWGNLFGVAKYEILPEEKALKGNALIYFEDRHDRLLEACVHEYEQVHTPAPTPAPTPHHVFASPFTIPKLTLARFQADDEQKRK